MNDPVINRKTKLEDLPELLTPMEVRAFLGLGRNTVYGLIESGELPSRRFGQRLFVPKKALMKGVTVG